MKKNIGLKLLTAAVVGVVMLILFNSNHQRNLPEKQEDPNNINAAIASQFNDNIRDVAARLQEAEKKVANLEAQNKTLQHREQPSAANGLNETLLGEIETLKAKIATIGQAPEEERQYPINEKTANQTAGIKDIDQLIMKRENNPTELAYCENLKNKHS